MITELAVHEATRLAELEATIDAGMQTFVHVGDALLEIRDSRLYRQTHSTFERYCRERWQMGRNHANKMIAAAEVVAHLGTAVPILPATEGQTRPLTALEPEQQREVWQRAVETAPNGKVTAAHVQTVVTSYREAINVEDGNGHVETMIPAKPHVANNSGNNEWYTPAVYVEAAREVMGGIDLDPASSVIANQVIQAEAFYTVEDDGLSHDWFGRVWMNPPYASDLIGQFSAKLAYHYGTGDVVEAVVLVNNATETGWFGDLIRMASAVIFPNGRVRFWKPDGELGAPLQGQAIIYLGNYPQVFLDVFSKFGWGASINVR